MPNIPKPAAERRRRNPTLPMAGLPASGRKGRCPRWPLSEQSPAERALWKNLWESPQALKWEEFGSERYVARYVRMLLICEATMNPVLLPLVMRMENSLGLNPQAMLTLRWEIVDDEAPARPVASSSARRLKAVDRGA